MKELGFVWHELMATDVARAEVVLAELFGWHCEAGAIRAGDREIGAIIPFEGAMGVGSHWVPQAATSELDAFCRELVACRGTICVPAVAHPGGGRFALVHDAARGFFSAREGGPIVPRAASPGSFWLDKLLVDDVAAAEAFYARLLGWHGRQSGPTWIVKRPPVAPMPMWLPHIVVDDVAAAAARAARLGAMVVVAPKQLAGAGTYAVFADAAAGIIAAIAPEVADAA